MLITLVSYQGIGMLHEIVKTAFEAGINTPDTAENYANGKSELEM